MNIAFLLLFNSSIVVVSFSWICAISPNCRSNEGLEEKSVEFFLEDDDPPPYEIDQIEEEKLARITAKAADELGMYPNWFRKLRVA